MIYIFLKIDIISSIQFLFISFSICVMLNQLVFHLVWKIFFKFKSYEIKKDLNY